MPRKHSHRLLGYCALSAALILLGAPKCIDFDDVFLGTDAHVVGPDAASLTACADPNQARVLVQNRAFINECGCAELGGSRTCTVFVGTKVLWRFADSEEHNVSSLANAFGRSEDRMSGTYEYTFTETGVFEYLCSIHPADMADYHVIVRNKGQQ